MYYIDCVLRLPTIRGLDKTHNNIRALYYYCQTDIASFAGTIEYYCGVQKKKKNARDKKKKNAYLLAACTEPLLFIRFCVTPSSYYSNLVSTI